MENRFRSGISEYNFSIIAALSTVNLRQQYNTTLYLNQRWIKPGMGWSPRIYIGLFFFRENIFCPRGHYFSVHILMLLYILPTINLHFTSLLKAIDRHFSSLFPRGLNFFAGELDFSAINRFLGGLSEARRTGVFHR